jgi:hypothetical protein
MTALRWTALACWGSLLAAACSGEPRPPSEPAPEPAAPPAAPAPAAPAPAVAQEQPADLEPTPEELPVREDFEEEAALQVTLANYRAELDKLEREIDERK